MLILCFFFSLFFFSSRRRHTICLSDWSSDVCSSDLLAHVLEAEMAELVRQHRLDFRVSETLEQRIEEHDALVAADAGEIGVAVARAARVVHDEYPPGSEAAAREQRFDALPQRLVLERREAVEERCDEYRPGPGHEEHDGEPQAPRPYPPAAAGPLHEQQRRNQQRTAEPHGGRQGPARVRQDTAGPAAVGAHA